MAVSMSATPADMDPAILVTREGELRAVVDKCEPDAASHDYLLYLSARFIRAMQRQEGWTDRQVAEMIKNGITPKLDQVVCDRKALRHDFEQRDGAVAQVLGEPLLRAAPPFPADVDANAPQAEGPQHP
jgi:hypothetical protein